MKSIFLIAFLLLASSSAVAEDIFAPTKDELALIGNDVFVLKRKPGNVVVTSYHKWLVISTENRLFRATGENKAVSYRAIALSIPLHLGAIGNEQMEAPYNGYIVGTATGPGGQTRVFPMNKIEWAVQE